MDAMELPVTRYALSGDVSVAFQVMGDGPLDIILIPGFMSHIEFQHELAGWTAFLRRLSKFARVITFDKRGQGLSDKMSDAPSLEQRMDDVRAIMDVVGSKRATLFGHSEGCAMSILFAATYPERVSKLILCGGYGKRRDLPDNFEELIRERIKLWGTGAMMKRVAPSLAANADAVAQFAKFERLSASPGAVKSFMLLNAQIDVSSILPSVRVPTLVLHRQKDLVIPVELGRELAAQIQDAKFIEYPGGSRFLHRRRRSVARRHRRVRHGASRWFVGRSRTRSLHGAVYRYRRFHAQRRRDRRSGVAKIAGQSRSIGDSDHRKASRYSGQVDRRWDFGDV